MLKEKLQGQNRHRNDNIKKSLELYIKYENKSISLFKTGILLQRGASVKCR